MGTRRKVDGPRDGRPGGPEDLCSQGLLRGRPGDRRDQQGGAERRAAQVLRPRRGQCPSRLARDGREVERGAGAGRGRAARPEGLAEARKKALELDKRAYTFGKKAYDRTPPSEPKPVARSQ